MRFFFLGMGKGKLGDLTRNSDLVLVLCCIFGDEDLDVEGELGKWERLHRCFLRKAREAPTCFRSNSKVHSQTGWRGRSQVRETFRAPSPRPIPVLTGFAAFLELRTEWERRSHYVEG